MNNLFALAEKMVPTLGLFGLGVLATVGLYLLAVLFVYLPVVCLYALGRRFGRSVRALKYRMRGYGRIKWPTPSATPAPPIETPVPPKPEMEWDLRPRRPVRVPKHPPAQHRLAVAENH